MRCSTLHYCSLISNLPSATSPPPPTSSFAIILRFAQARSPCSQADIVLQSTLLAVLLLTLSLHLLRCRCSGGPHYNRNRPSMDGNTSYLPSAAVISPTDHGGALLIVDITGLIIGISSVCVRIHLSKRAGGRNFFALKDDVLCYIAMVISSPWRRIQLKSKHSR
jgi:hypothetical protein